MASSGQPFGSRSYTAGKLPDRSMNANAIPFSASSFSRRGLGAAQSEFVPEAAKSSQQAPQQAVHAQSHNPSQESNPLSRLTEEQREEINEAVRPTHLSTNCRVGENPRDEILTVQVHPLRPRPRQTPRLPRAPRRLPRARLHPPQTRTHLPPNNLRRAPPTSASPAASRSATVPTAAAESSALVDSKPAAPVEPAHAALCLPGCDGGEDSGAGPAR